MKRIALVLALGLLSLGAKDAPKAPPKAPDPVCTDDSSWTDPGAPFRIFGNTWYVGSCGVSAILITSKAGHVLIDVPMDQNVPMIEANIQRAGFKLKDIKYILFSHSHFDHIGGVARMARDTGATVVGRGSDADAVERGKGGRDDPQFYSSGPFPAHQPVQRLDQGLVLLGSLALTPVPTTGHTPGSTSWTWRSCEKKRCVQIVYADSLTAISDDDYKFSDEAANPGYAQAFRDSVARIGKLDCDLLITPHPSASAMWERFGPTATRSPIDPTACHALSLRTGKLLEARLAKEAAGIKP
ncbi:subclass B3 metallo-beta-lactamase [Novosphingobium sp. B 225]|uniref:subclass B3 metallo-beta-lactamase n=1 Tax=Novosphingobium sp. B 225 TaxID=1961849 RepID=UPI000B4AAD25|nr:subclass B3 metallo-beta-lactamase [Novosphingobium sp. B 225]